MERLKSQKVEPPPEIHGEYLMQHFVYVLIAVLITQAGFWKCFFVTFKGNAVPEIHSVDNQLHPEQEAQPQGRQLPPQAPEDTPQEPQNHEQQNQDQALEALPQTHQDLPPGHQVAQGQHNLP